MEILFSIIAAVIIYKIFANRGAQKDSSDNHIAAKKVQHTVQFHYRRKPFFMTKPENDFFDVLVKATEGNYYVFPQFHLSTILDHKFRSQNWEHALRYINQKSVDYVICDKQYRKPLVAIELDDWSHDSEERKQRDANVEHMLERAGIPLLRFRNIGDASEDELLEKIRDALPQVLTNSTPSTEG